MSNLHALIRRELSVYFVSPMAYIILTAFMALNGVYFYVQMEGWAAARSPVQFGQVQIVMIYLLTLVTPLITMRLIAEEKSRGTIETMMTAPVSEWSFVLAKFLASFLFVCYLVFPTICYVVLAGKYGDVDKGATLVGYIGILLGIAPILAIGLLISSLSANQITAGVLTLIASMLLMILPLIAIRLPEGSWWSEFLRGAFDQVNILGHMEAYARGVLDSRSCVYLVSVVFLFLFLTVRILESRRWR